MADWKTRAEINNDVVFFRYVETEVEKKTDVVFVWDLDKTYLDTSWGSVRELLRTALERAFQKKNIPGTSTLLQALKENWSKQNPEIPFPIYFITASPPQMEGRIIEKLNLDGIHPYGCFFKDNLRNLRPKSFWRLTKQVGFKLHALMQLRSRLHPEVRQILWGDDSESDAIIYNLYSDLCSRRISDKEVQRILGSFHVLSGQMEKIFVFQAQMPAYDPVKKIYINLAADTDPDYYLKFGRRTLPTYNTFETALDLMQDGWLHEGQVASIGGDMVDNYGFTQDELTQSFDELAKRRVLGDEAADQVKPSLVDGSVISPQFAFTTEPKKVATREEKQVIQLDGVLDPWIPEHIDYLHDYR